MGIRLLDRQEINKRKASERKREIDEGLKLARNVDNLRELRAKEDTGLQDWRAKTIAMIHAEIQVKTTEKAKLSREVKELRDAAANAWAGITDEKERLARQAEILDEKSAHLEKFKLSLDAREVYLNGSIFDVKQKKLLIDDMHSESSEKLKEASKMNEDAEKNSQVIAKTITDLVSRKADIVAKEMEFERNAEEKEASLKKRELALVEAERELGKREKRVRDDLKTLAKKR